MSILINIYYKFPPTCFPSMESSKYVYRLQYPISTSSSPTQFEAMMHRITCMNPFKGFGESKSNNRTSDGLFVDTSSTKDKGPALSKQSPDGVDDCILFSRSTETSYSSDGSDNSCFGLLNNSESEDVLDGGVEHVKLLSDSVVEHALGCLTAIQALPINCLTTPELLLSPDYHSDSEDELSYYCNMSSEMLERRTRLRSSSAVDCDQDYDGRCNSHIWEGTRLYKRSKTVFESIETLDGDSICDREASQLLGHITPISAVSTPAPVESTLVVNRFHRHILSDQVSCPRGCFVPISVPMYDN
jgi:hypothetical protein